MSRGPPIGSRAYKSAPVGAFHNNRPGPARHLHTQELTYVNATDQMRSGAPGGAESVSPAEVGEVLARMAGHLSTVRPNDLLTPVALGASMAGEVHNVRGGASLGEGADLSEATRAALPLADFTLSRAGYAVLLVEAAVECGWSDDVDEPMIPRMPVPGPRREPAPAPRPGVPGPRPASRVGGVR